MIAARLNELGIILPEASAPAAKYANAVIVNGLMYVSGKGPDTVERGKLGEDFTTEQGYEICPKCRDSGARCSPGCAGFTGPGETCGQSPGFC